MQCKYCNSTFRPNRLTKDLHVCPECEGIIDDLSIDDEEIKVEAWNLRHPTGKTKPIFQYDLETEDI